MQTSRETCLGKHCNQDVFYGTTITGIMIINLRVKSWWRCVRRFPEMTVQHPSLSTFRSIWASTHLPATRTDPSTASQERAAPRRPRSSAARGTAHPEEAKPGAVPTGRPLCCPLVVISPCPAPRGPTAHPLSAPMSQPLQHRARSAVLCSGWGTRALRGTIVPHLQFPPQQSAFLPRPHEAPTSKGTLGNTQGAASRAQPLQRAIPAGVGGDDVWRCWFPHGAILQRGCRSGATSGASQVVAGAGRLRVGAAWRGRGLRRGGATVFCGSLVVPPSALLAAVRAVWGRVLAGQRRVRTVLGLVGVIKKNWKVCGSIGFLVSSARCKLAVDKFNELAKVWVLWSSSGSNTGYFWLVFFFL